MAQTPLSTPHLSRPEVARPSSQAYLATGIVAVWALGVLTSAVFNHALGRDPLYFYREESLLADFVWGVRALFPPALYGLMALVVARVLAVLWRSAVRFVPPLTRLVLDIRRRSFRAIGGVPVGESAKVAQWLLAAQVVAVGTAVWIFSPYIRAYASFLDVAPPHLLAVLGYESYFDLHYRLTFSILILVMGVAWWRLLGAARERGPVDRITTVAGLGVMLLAVALVVAPFRLEAQEFRVAFYAGHRCSVMGERASMFQLFCPTVTPRVRAVPGNDPALELRGDRDFIFKPRHTVETPTPN